ncbi:hypothetical protein [Pustulibacterium marinum]|uniref:hypothetical protein n=1 Tax=Pustulibacterium marinum TaxID=1224947 RepID=UPI000B804FB6|nr:hypothetical protein [Pustulibacterium marinum]
MFTCYTNAQEITGKVEDSLHNPLRDIKVMNTRTKMVTFSNSNGVFMIPAQKKDTLLFTSMFFEDKTRFILRSDFKHFMIVSLQDKVNVLEAVEVTDTLIVQDFDDELYTANLQMQLKNDIKNHPEYYMTKNSNGLDILKAGQLTVDLFTKQKKEENPFLSYDDLTTLYENENYFSSELVTKQIGIPSDKVYLFFTYCGHRHLAKSLLEEKNQFLFLDYLFKAKEEFMDRLNDNKQD